MIQLRGQQFWASETLHGGFIQIHPHAPYKSKDFSLFRGCLPPKHHNILHCNDATEPIHATRLQNFLFLRIDAPPG